MSAGLTPEQKELALYAARGGIIDLLGDHPALAIRIGADDLTTIYLAGVVAGADAALKVIGSLADEL